MLGKFESMLDGYLVHVTNATHRAELSTPAKKPINSISNRAGPKRRDLDKNEIDNIFSMNAIKPALTECVYPIAFAPNNDGTIRFCIDYRRLNAVAVRDSYSLPMMDE